MTAAQVSSDRDVYILRTREGALTQGGIGARFKFRRPLLYFFFFFFCGRWEASSPSMPAISGAVARIIKEHWHHLLMSQLRWEGICTDRGVARGLGLSASTSPLCDARCKKGTLFLLFIANYSSDALDSIQGMRKHTEQFLSLSAPRPSTKRMAPSINEPNVSIHRRHGTDGRDNGFLK